MTISDKTSSADVHQTASHSNSLNDADFLEQQKHQLAAVAQSVNTNQKIVQNLEFSAHANSCMQLGIGNGVHGSAGVQQNQSSFIAIADQAPEPILTDDVKNSSMRLLPQPLGKSIVV